MNKSFGIAILAVVVLSLTGVESVMKDLVAEATMLREANLKRASQCVRDGGQWVPLVTLFTLVPGDGFCALP